jgi:dGTPase
MNSIRETTELLEKQTLSEFAALSMNSKGRRKPLEKCEIRTEFQRDRDRIIHCKAFRRLKHKTQVFLSPEGDHYRTRLTHTLEVAQIGRTIARALRLNEDLTEAIALGHDLGHTPFGHSGEQVLDEICPCGFKHNEQSLRVAEALEGDGGLNLTYEVRDGILNHTGKTLPVTLEGQIIRYADKIAYINHDIDDALRAGILSIDQLPAELIGILGMTSSQRINTMIKDIICNSQGKDAITMSSIVGDAMLKLREFMFENVYLDSSAKVEESKAKNIIKELYNYIKSHPEIMPQEKQVALSTDDIDKVVCDYIAGMTDRYAIKKYMELFVPLGWGS